MGKKIISLLISVTFIITTIFGNIIYVSAETLEGFKLMAKNSKYELYFESEYGGIAVKDITTGKTWRSYPEDFRTDFSKGFMKFNIPSHIVFEVSDKDGNTTVYNSYIMGIRNENYKIKSISNGFRIDYNFQEQGIKLSIEFTITQYGLTVRIPVDSIKETNKDISLNRIWLMPYFVSAKRGSNGYMFVPDGSGAIIDLKSYVSYDKGIDSMFYGYDYSIPFTEMLPRTEKLRMPVYGIKNNDTGVLAVIRQGDYYARLISEAGGSGSNYFRTYPIFTYRELYKYTLFEGQTKNNQSPGDITETLIAKNSPYHMKSDIIVDYYFLTGEKANYSGMAEAYRNYLLRNGLLKNYIKSNDIPLNLTLLGGIKKRTLVLGLPFMLVHPMTTYDQATEILKLLKKAGVEKINLRYKGFQEDGYISKITNGVEPEGKLGGAKGLKKLIEFSRANNVKLFLNAELIEIHEPGNGFNESRDGDRYLNNALIFLWQWCPIDKRKETGAAQWFLTLPSRVPYFANNFINDLAKKYNLDAVSFEHMGDYIYSQTKKGNVLLRDQVAKVWTNVFQNAKNKLGNLMLTGGNVYTFSTANMLVEVPLDISHYSIEKEAVPFYQMVIHGYIPYSGKPGNLRQIQKDEFLRMIEYGAIPYFELIYEDGSEMMKTNYKELYSATYKDWLSQAVNEYKVAKNAYKDIYNKKMIDHQKLKEGIYKTTYENGVSIIVNYNNSNFVYNGKTVKAKDFIVVK
ncbi:DUF5696 domain-containing protein [Caldicellulosiruptoraceae bacterium PP1]